LSRSDAPAFCRLAIPRPPNPAGKLDTVLCGSRCLPHGTDRIRATYRHCCLRYVMNEKMANQSLRERFRLSQKKTQSVSRAIRDAVDAGKIKLASPEQTCRARALIPAFFQGEQDEDGEVLPAGCLREAILRLNPAIPREALETTKRYLLVRFVMRINPSTPGKTRPKAKSSTGRDP